MTILLGRVGRRVAMAVFIALTAAIAVPAPVPGVSVPRAAAGAPTPSGGYWLVASDGGIFSYGNAGFHGSAGGIALNRPIVGMAPTPDGGYWLVASDGGIFSYGNAGFHGSAGGIALNRPIVGMAPTPDGGGYWLVASDGGIFSYGNAGFHGSAGGIALNRPIVGMAPTPDGGGYWLVASDGGIFSYGNAGFHGSAGGIALNRPIVGMAPTPDGGGYWLVASDGGIFSYGNAGFHGSAGGIALNRPIVGMAPTPDGGGYWLVASDGGIFSYGNAGFHGSAGGIALNRPIVGMAISQESLLGMEPPAGFTSRHLIFDDQFTGTTLDPTKWNTYMTSRAANGWPWNDNGAGGSGENLGGFGAAYYQPSQVSVDNGLTLTAVRASTQSGYAWTSGVVSTYGKFQFDGGYVQVEARVPRGDGMWPSFWMLPGPGGTNGDDNELDLFEGNFTDNGAPPEENAAWHLITPAGSVGDTTDTETDLTGGYHIYGVDWVPGQSITWYVDGRPIGQVTNSPQSPIPDEPMELILDLMVANASAGGFRTTYDGSTPSPSTVSVAGVQVYS